MSRARRLAGEISQAIASAVDDGRLDAERVRRFIVSPSPSFDVLRLQASPYLDDQGRPDPGAAFAEIPLSDFLDEVDALEPPAKEALQDALARRIDALHDTVRGAIAQAATGELSALPGAPGFFLAWRGRAVDPVAFCRPDAAPAVAVVDETGARAWVIAGDAGYLVFRPDDAATLPFADLQWIREAPGGVRFRRKGEGGERAFAARDDAGTNALRIPARKSPVFFDPLAFPAGDATRWTALYESTGAACGPTLVRLLAARSGRAAIPSVLERLRGADRAAALALWDRLHPLPDVRALSAPAWPAADPEALDLDFDAALASTTEQYEPERTPLPLEGEPLAGLGPFTLATRARAAMSSTSVCVFGERAVGERVVIATRDGAVRILDGDLREIDRAERIGAVSALAAGDGWLAALVGGLLVILDPTAEPIATLHLEDGDPRAIAGRGTRLYCATEAGLVVVDPLAPRALGRLPFPCDSVEISGDRALAGGRLLDLSDPARPARGLHALPWARRLLSASPERFVAADDSIAWTIETPRGAKPRVTSGSAIAAGPAALAGDRLVCGTRVYARRAATPPRVDASEEKLGAFLEETLAAADASFTLGAVVLARTGSRFRAVLDAPRSLAGLEDEAIAPGGERTLDLSDLGAFETGDLRRDAAVRRAWRGAMERSLRRLASSAAFRRIACGRVWLAIRERGGPAALPSLAWVHVALDPAREWRPHRRRIPRPAPGASLEARLSAEDGARHVDAVASQARNDWTMRAELLEIASRGYEYALRAAALLADFDEDGVVRAFLTAVSDSRPEDDPAELAWRLDFLETRRARPGVADVLARFGRGRA